jgi:murein DD-endopeptidase MepM/ murein hydrolase activator NlpD
MSGGKDNQRVAFMRIFIFLKYPLICLILMMQLSAFSDDTQIFLSSKNINQGGVVFIKITKKDSNTPEVKWFNKRIPLLYRQDKKGYEGFIAADLKQKPGTFNLDLLINPSGTVKKVKIRVHAKDYGVRNLRLPPDKVNLSAKDLKRADKEKAVMEKIWAGPVTPPEWKTPFIMPIESMVTGIFGKRSIINDQPRSPHSGVDLRGKKGESVKAANDGSIVYIGDHFFTGNSVVIDHGGGIFSMYFHLDKINVKKGDKILKGETLGTVGSTGRSTEPHLHWGMRINNMRVDPISFVKLSNNLEE